MPPPPPALTSPRPDLGRVVGVYVSMKIGGLLCSC
jgi:hypothetical protein